MPSLKFKLKTSVFVETSYKGCIGIGDHDFGSTSVELLCKLLESHLVALSEVTVGVLRIKRSHFLDGRADQNRPDRLAAPEPLQSHAEQCALFGGLHYIPGYWLFLPNPAKSPVGINQNLNISLFL